MKELLKKEIKLAMHPTAPMFIILSLMLIIPNYPYYVIFFYTGLAVFFTCLNGRENNDIFYTMLLPVAKKDVVKSRFLFVIILELLQVIVAIPFALIRQSFPLPGNAVGMDANIAFFGLSFIMLGIFNFVFFSIYYKNVDKVGKAFNWSTAAVFTYMLIAEVSTHAIPYFRNCLDTKDPQYLTGKLITLFIGLLIYVVLTFCVLKKSIKNFENIDL